MTSAIPTSQVQRVALIVAAGTGTRMTQTLPKQYLALNEQPMLRYSVAVLCAEPAIDHVFVVLHPEDKWFVQYDWKAYEGRLQAEYCGGPTRAQSVLHGLQRLRSRLRDADWVVVHDAARPCLTNQLLGRLLSELANDDVGGLLAIPVADTLKREDGARRCVRTEARDLLWQAQTPQMFRYGLLLRAMEQGDLSTITDEASAVERLGWHPQLVPGSAANLKVTYAEDAQLAALILRARQ
jgi:2-C-methyl-D-erythritol 4-phosphate cytidylyltransferase